MKKELTIIMPCYNSSQYIEKNLNSILSQTYNDFNIILIDDKSTDNTLEIIKKYKNNSKNIIIIENDKNRGAGYCRNEALKLCDTKYVTFIDSDDYINKDYLDKMISLLKKQNADVIVCDIKLEYENKFKMICTCDDEISKKNIIANGLAAAPCNKIFITELFNEIKFPEGIINEDVAAILSILINADKITYTSDVYYNYVQHSNSVQNEKFTEKKFDIFKSIDILKKNNCNNLYFEEIIFSQLILFLFYKVAEEKSFIKRYKYLKKYYKLSKNYNILKNNSLKKYIQNCGRFHKIYYYILVLLLINHLILIDNFWISTYHLLKKISKKKVLKKEYNLDKLIKLAKKNINKKSYKLSVIIPNYNYSKFLYQRLYSILNQKVRIDELIILDDFSTDNSREIIEQIKKELIPFINIKVYYNNQNSGSAFAQWKKGIQISTQEYIWIAEADDYCDKDFLKKVFVKMLKNKKIVLSYSDTSMIDVDGNIIQRSVKNDIDLQNTKHWEHSFVNNGLNELRDYAYLNCTIANVSSVIMKKIKFDDIFDDLSRYKQAGDWLFYIKLMCNGDISYINKRLNYYRVHGVNATSLNKKQLHFNEIKKIHNFIKKNYGLDKEQLKKIDERYFFLEKKWKIER